MLFYSYMTALPPEESLTEKYYSFLDVRLLFHNAYDVRIIF